MRIAILTQYFPPEVGAPQVRLFELAKRLRKRGHDITVVTAMPNYPAGRVFDAYRRRLFCVEQMEGVKVIRTPIYPSRSGRLMVRLASYMSFVMSSLLLGTWSLGRQDVLVVESPPLFLGLSGVAMSFLTRSRMVLMVSDIWPDVALRMGNIISARQAGILVRLESFLYRRSDCVALTNRGAVEQIKSRFPDVPCAIISNGVDTTVFRPELRSEVIRAEFGISRDQFAVAYCGLHGFFQGLDVVVEAAKRLRDESRVRFVMIGDGNKKRELVARAREAGLENIAFFPQQSYHRMPEILASMDASLILLAASLPGTMPSKAYEALASGIPMIVTAGCEAEQFVHRNNTGRVIEPGNAEALATAVRELASNPRCCEEAGSNSAILAQHFDLELIVERTEKLLRAVVVGDPLPDVEW